MKKEVFFIIIGIVLFCSGVFALSIGYIIMDGMNFHYHETLKDIGAFLMILGSISFISSGVIIFLNKNKEKQE